MNWKYFLSFKGRINRKPFWIFNLCVSILWLVLILSSGADLRHLTKEPMNIIFDITVLWPTLAVQVKRWHDINKSAWYILINLIPIAGPIWTFIQTGFIPGTTGDNRFGKNPIAKHESVNQKVYISGESTPYFMETVLFVMVPLCLLWLTYVAWVKGNLEVLVLIIPIFIALIVVFIFFKRKRVIKIILDDEGIYFQGFLRSIYSPWAKVISAEKNMKSLKDMIEVKTENGNFNFSLFMKNESEQYPKLSTSSLSGFKWIYADGEQRVTTIENCPLYIHIKNKIKEKNSIAPDALHR